MIKKSLCLLIALALLFAAALTGCGPAPAAVETAPPTAAPTPSPAPETPAPTPTPTPAPTASAEPAVPADPAAIHDPLLAPPVVEEDVTEYFDDVIIMGDSLTYSLYQWESLYDGLGDALFFVRGGTSIMSLLDGRFNYFYNGEEKSAEDAVAACGRSKLYILMGANDIPQFGVEKSFELFDTLLGRILEKTPNLEIHIESLTPVWTDAQFPGFTNEEFEEYNELLKAYAEENGYGYVDIAPYFRDSTGGIAEAYCSDKLVHASYEGAGVWVQVLKAYIVEQLKNAAE